jgi:hypothetical protein
MTNKNENALELSDSGEVLWNEKGNWNDKVLESLLGEAYSRDLKDNQEILVTYKERNENFTLGYNNKAKTLRELKQNYFFWNGREYSPEKVVQNL